MLKGRLGRWVRRLLKSAAIVLAVLLAVHTLVLPPLARWQIAAALANAGYAEARFTLRHVSFWRADLADVQLAGGALRIASISADYSPASLLRGRFHSIRIAGAQANLAIRDGRLDLSALLPSGADGPGGLPAERVVIDPAVVMLDWEGRPIRLIIDGTLLDQAPQVKFDGSAHAHGATLSYSGTFNTSNGHLALSAGGRQLPLAAAPTLVGGDLERRLPRLSGHADLRLVHVQSAEGLHTSIALTLHSAYAQRANAFEAEGVDGDLTVSIDQRLRLSDIQADLRAERVSLPPQSLRNVALTAGKDGRRLGLRIMAEGESWRLAELTALIDGVIGQPLDGPKRADGRATARGALPAELRTALAGAGVDVSRLGELSFVGPFTINWAGAAASEAAADASTAPWLVVAGPAELMVSPGQLSLKDGPALNGLIARLLLKAQIDPRNAAMELLGGSRMAADGLKLHDAWTIAHDGRRALLELLVRGDSARANFSLHSSTPEWRVEVPRLLVNFGPGDIATDAATINGAGAELIVQGSAGPAGIAARVLGESVLAFGSARVEAAEPLRVAGMELRPRGGTDGPGISLSFDPSRRRLGVVGAMESRRKVEFGAANFSAGAQQLSLQMDLAAEAAAGLSGRFIVDLGDGWARAPGLRLVAEEVWARVPFHFKVEAPEPGEVRAEVLRMGAADLGPLTARVTVSDGRAQFDAHLGVLGMGQAAAKGWAALETGQVRGRIDLDVPRFELTDADAMARLVPVLEGEQVSGALAATGRLEFAGAQFRPRFTLHAHNLSMVNAASQRTVEGISGSLTVDGLAPLTTPPGQKLTIERATLGQLSFANGVFVFRVEDAESTLFEDVGFDFAGGRIYASSFRLLPAAGRLDTVISADRLQLGQVLRHVSDRLAGEGALYGRLPLSIRWPRVMDGGQLRVNWSQPQPNFGEGFLYAAPGGGFLQIRDPEALLAQQLEQDPRFRKGGDLEPVKTGIFDALRDLAYTVLKVDFEKYQDGFEEHLRARVFIAGRGRRGPRPQEFGGITINFNNFDEVLIRSIGYGQPFFSR
jgi:hypothetical protein